MKFIQDDRGVLGGGVVMLLVLGMILLIAVLILGTIFPPLIGFIGGVLVIYLTYKLAVVVGSGSLIKGGFILGLLYIILMSFAYGIAVFVPRP